jgi:hypothetical protein
MQAAAQLRRARRAAEGERKKGSEAKERTMYKHDKNREQRKAGKRATTAELLFLV